MVDSKARPQGPHSTLYSWLVATGGSSDWMGSLTVKVEPLPTTLSTRMRPWCCSMICRQTLSPRPVPPWPFSSGSLVV